MKEKSNKEEIFEEYVLPEDFDEKKEAGMKGKFTHFLESPWWAVSVMVLVAISAFSLGKYSYMKSNREPVRIIYPSAVSTSSSSLEQVSFPKTKNSNQTAAAVNANPGYTRPSSSAVSDAGGRVVASKNSTKYHYPWCGGAKQISPQNLIVFNSIEEARKAGYTPAANCKGLK